MYKVGETVAYGLHGKCVIVGIETKELSTGSVTFYQMRQVKNSIIPRLPSSTDPFILIPVDSAAEKGLRPLMTKEQAEEILKVLSQPEDYFANETWVYMQKKLEDAIRKEGALGLAKVVSQLYLFLKQDVVPQASVLKFYESTYRVLAREIADSLGMTSKDVEPLVQKALKNRLTFEA